MIQRVVTFTEYWFVPDIGGTDHLEGHQWTIDRTMGKGVVHFHNKKGGVLRLMFLGEMTTTQKANMLASVEWECKLKFIGQKEVQYLPQFEQNMKNIYGKKLIVK